MKRTEPIVDRWFFHLDQPDFRSQLKRQYLVRVTSGVEHERDFKKGLCEAHDFIFGGSTSPSGNPPFDSVWLGRDDVTGNSHLFDLRTGVEIDSTTRMPVATDPANQYRIVPVDLPSLRKACGRSDLP